MTLAVDAECNRRALIEQLYVDWRGYYMLRRLFMGHWIDSGPLTKEQAEKYTPRPDEALEIKLGECGL